MHVWLPTGCSQIYGSINWSSQWIRERWPVVTQTCYTACGHIQTAAAGGWQCREIPPVQVCLLLLCVYTPGSSPPLCQDQHDTPPAAPVWDKTVKQSVTNKAGWLTFECLLIERVEKSERHIMCRDVTDQEVLCIQIVTMIQQINQNTFWHQFPTLSHTNSAYLAYFDPQAMAIAVLFPCCPDTCAFFWLDVTLA